MQFEHPGGRQPDSRWKVFLSTAKDLLGAYLPRVFLINLPIFLGVGVDRQGWNLQAVFDGILFTAIIMMGFVILCVGFALHIALIYRKDGSYNKEA